MSNGNDFFVILINTRGWQTEKTLTMTCYLNLPSKRITLYSSRRQCSWIDSVSQYHICHSFERLHWSNIFILNLHKILCLFSKKKLKIIDVLNCETFFNQLFTDQHEKVMNSNCFGMCGRERNRHCFHETMSCNTRWCDGQHVSLTTNAKHFRQQ
jgi:hypothetical protein